MALVVPVFNVIQNSFVRWYCENCHISMHFKNLPKLVRFCVKWKLLSHVWLFVTPWTIHSPWNSSGQNNTGVGSLSLLQVIFPTEGSNPGLPHRRRILYQLSYQECQSFCVAILILKVEGGKAVFPVFYAFLFQER